MPTNRDFLVADLAARPQLDGRYSDLKCVNYDPRLRAKLQGCFSLVFSAWDDVTEQRVAIKFFDPVWIGDAYRRKGFEREPEILKTLVGRRRCLQIIGELKTHSVSVGDPKTPVTVPFSYFTVQWLDDRLDQYFESQEAFDASTKLDLFRDILLGVEALHRQEVHHRDLKPDNLRSYLEHLKRVVVAIDLGTAARLASFPLTPSSIYPPGPVGHMAYSAPEAHCGLASHRTISKYSDYWALGCMLYELFSPVYFAEELEATGTFLASCAALSHLLAPVARLEDRLRLYDTQLPRFAHAVKLPDFTSYSAVVPEVVAPLLSKALAGLTALDYRDRVPALDVTRNLVDAAIRVLANRGAADTRLKRMRQERMNRAKRLEAKQERLAAYLRARAASGRLGGP